MGILPIVKRDTHALNEEGMVLCNPRDKEASHRAFMGDIQTSQKTEEITCNFQIL